MGSQASKGDVATEGNSAPAAAAADAAAAVKTNGQVNHTRKIVSFIYLFIYFKKMCSRY